MYNLITINCNGLRDPLKVNYLKQLLNSRNIDICFIQETHIDNVDLGYYVERKLNAKCFWSFTDNSKNKGVGLIFRKDMDCKVLNIKFDHFGRYICIDVNLDGYECKLISVYAPNNGAERKHFFHDLYGNFMGSNPIILGGDFNCVENIAIDKLGGNEKRGDTGTDQLKKILTDFNLIDTFRKKYPHNREFTWSSQGVSVRLDRFYVSKCLLPNLNNVFHDMYSFSDHHLVNLVLSPFNHQKIGKSYWKFNASLLNDLDYIDFMTNFLHNNIQNIPENEDMLVWWDNLKDTIKLKTIKFSLNKNKRQRYYLNHLREEYMHYHSTGNNYKANEIKEEIKNIELESLKGAQIRSKTEELEGEKPSKYFLYKELKNSKRKIINKITIDNNFEVIDSLEILDIFKDFYSNLFQGENVDDEVIDNFLCALPHISQTEADTLGKDISSDEILDCLKSFKNGKSPGSDGLTKEFYLAFIEILLPLLLKLYNIIYESEKLSVSQKLSYISLLCKDDQNPNLVTNYRPISLLNVDYKILTKILSSRLENVLDQIVHPDQTCSVPGRSIIDNCHLLRDIIEYSNQKNIDGILLSLDQEKAFDRVSHSYLFKVLKAFGLGDKFIKWIIIFYTDISSCIIVNQFISDPFPVTRSVRQGCCLSPLLYILCLEPLMIKIRNDPNVKGFKLPGRDTEQKITAFADDSNFTVKDDKSAGIIIDHFVYFEKASGSKLNKTKSKGLFLGKWKTRSDHPFGISWVDKVKVFGIMYGNVCDSEMWNPIYKKIVNVINLYKGRNLSLYGKALIVNVMVLSKLWYMCSVLCVPNVFIDLIEKEIFSFIWSDKMELISRNSCYFPKDKGGIALVDIKMKIASIQLCQISKIVYNRNLSWTAFGDFWFGIQLHKLNDYIFSNSMPHCIEDLPNYYDSLKKVLNITNSVFDNVSIMKNARCKTYYLNLIDIFMKRNDLIVAQKYTNVNFSQVFANVSNRVIDPFVVNVTFKLAHRVLPVADRLYNFGIAIDKKCTFCKNENETMTHLFFYCTHIQWCKRFLASWIFDICNFGISLDLILFSVPKKDCKKHDLSTILILLSEFRFSIWNARNKVRFDKKELSPADIASNFLNRVKVRIQVDFHRLDSILFRNIWLHDSLICFENGNIVYNFNL